MLRAVTAGLICFLAGVSASQRLNQRVRDLRIWLQALERLAAQCACLRLPPGEMLQNALGDRTRDLKKYLLTHEECAGIEACLKSVLNDTQEQQLRQLQYVIRQLEEALAQAQMKQNQDAGLFGSLGLLGGLCVFLLCL